MSFLGLTFLAALPLAAAPILLHLFDRQRSVVIEWGAIQFLQEAATRKTSARRVRHWLLLLLRVAALAALVLALARPMLPGHWFGGRARQETIIVLDNSLSTQRDAGQQTAFEQLVERAGGVLDGLASGDSVRVLLTSPYPVWATPASLRIDAASRSDLRDRLQQLRPTGGAGDLRPALLKAVQAEVADETIAQRRVVLLTDGQRANWKTSDVAPWTRFRQTLADAPLPTRVETIEAAGQPARQGNVAVNRLRANREVISVYQPLTIRAEVQNYGATSSKGCAAAWSIDQQTKEQATAPMLAAGQTQELIWKHTFDRTGVFAVSCRIEAEDQLPGDNAASIVVEVVDRVPVLLAENAGELAELQQDAFLVRAALGRIAGNETDDYRAVFEPQSVAPERLETIDLDEFRVVVIPSFTALSRKAVQRLSQFVDRGGGLWAALGPRTDVREFNKLLYNNGDGLSPLAIDGVVDEPGDEGKRTTINPFQKTHPATAELADNERLDTGDVKVSRRFRFRKADSAGDATVLLDLTNGEPLAVERRVGRGRVIVQAVPLAMPWSELAVSQAFVVMVHDWLGYLAEPGGTRHNLQPGEAISLLTYDVEQAEATLATPAGDVTVSGEPVEQGLEFYSTRTILPGDYSLEMGLSGDAIPFHVARDAVESDLAALTSADRAFLAETAGLGNGAAPGVSVSIQRDPIWPALLLLLIGLIVGELLLSGAIARQRFGVEQILETSAPAPFESSRSSFSGETWSKASLGKVASSGAAAQTAATAAARPSQEKVAAEFTTKN